MDQQQQPQQQQPGSGAGAQQGAWPSQGQQQPAQQPSQQMPMAQGSFVPLAQQQQQQPQQMMMMQPGLPGQMDPMGQMGSMPMMPMQFGSMQMPPMTPMQMQMMMMQMFSMMPQNFGSFYPPGQMPMNPAQPFPGQPFPDQFQQQQQQPQQFRQPDPYQQDPNLFPPPLGPSQIIPARSEMIRLAHGPGSARQWIDSCYGRMDSNLDFVLKEWFQSVDQDRSGHIDKEELKMALNAAGETFSVSTIRMMVDMFDTDKNGTIDFDEFRHLFKYIQVLREAFEAQDRDRDNRLNLGEVRQALSQAQYDFKDPKTTVKLLQRFDPKERNALVFENFVELAIQLGQTRTLFTKLDTDKDKLIKLNLDEVVSLTLDYS